MKHFTIISMEDGKIKNRKIVSALFGGLKDGRYILEINDYNRRSSPQNRYYWGLVIPLIQKGIKDLGTDLTKEETHEFLKARFNIANTDIVNEQTGETINIPLSTTRLNKEQFGEYIERIQRFGAEFLGIEIPDPGQQLSIYEMEERE